MDYSEGEYLSKPRARSPSRAERNVVEVVLAAFRDTQQAQQLLLLYQLSIKLFGCEQPDDVIRISLDLLAAIKRAPVVRRLCGSTMNLI